MSGLIILTGVFVTAFISGVFGMAGGLILMGILALVLPVSAAMVVHGVVQSVSNGWRAILHARWIDWRILGIYLFGSGAAAALLVLATFELSKPWLFIVLGLVPGVIWLPRRWVHFDAARPSHAVACGFTVTGLNVVAGVSGPLFSTLIMSLLSLRGGGSYLAESAAYCRGAHRRSVGSSSVGRECRRSRDAVGAWRDAAA